VDDHRSASRRRFNRRLRDADEARMTMYIFAAFAIIAPPLAFIYSVLHGLDAIDMREEQQ
jgi:hypothetical protein